jgi:hypothetical protein
MRRLLFLFLFMCLLAAPVARATVLLPADFKDHVTGSQAIVRGRVVDVRAEWMDGRRRIDTLVTVEAAEYLKGDFGESVTFRVPGGELGRYRTILIGAPTFREGEEVVLFLNAQGPSVPYLFGLGQGVFRIVQDPRSGQRVVTPPALLAASAQGGRVVRGAPGRRPVALDVFGAQVRQALSDRPARPGRRR